MSAPYRDWYDALMAEKAEQMRKADRCLIARSEEWDENALGKYEMCDIEVALAVDRWVASFARDPEFRAAGERGRK